MSGIQPTNGGGVSQEDDPQDEQQLASEVAVGSNGSSVLEVSGTIDIGTPAPGVDKSEVLADDDIELVEDEEDVGEIEAVTSSGSFSTDMAVAHQQFSAGNTTDDESFVDEDEVTGANIEQHLVNKQEKLVSPGGIPMATKAAKLPPSEIDKSRSRSGVAIFGAVVVGAAAVGGYLLMQRGEMTTTTTSAAPYNNSTKVVAPAPLAMPDKEIPDPVKPEVPKVAVGDIDTPVDSVPKGARVELLGSKQSGFDTICFERLGGRKTVYGTGFSARLHSARNSSDGKDWWARESYAQGDAASFPLSVGAPWGNCLHRRSKDEGDKLRLISS